MLEGDLVSDGESCCGDRVADGVGVRRAVPDGRGELLEVRLLPRAGAVRIRSKNRHRLVTSKSKILRLSMATIMISITEFQVNH